MPARIAAIHRTRAELLSPEGPLTVLPGLPASDLAAGDWVCHDGARITRRLDPTTEIARRGAGETASRQLVAANVDTLGIVTSCNADFNVARLERYLAIASAARCLPLIVLTKSDIAEDARAFLRQAEAISPLAMAMTLDARDPEEADRLSPWCGAGQTLALVGSSGVGKTTLQNHLTGTAEATLGIREDDAKGRHTTTYRALRRTLAGGWLIDTPGMRELGMADVGEGIDAVFSDISDLVGQCRFRDCAHETEPGCAVLAAIEAGTLDEDRVLRWRKLQREDAHNSRSIAESRARGRALNKVYAEGRARSRSKRGK